MPLELRQVAKTFARTTVLDNLSLDIRDGAFHTLLGPSGCGKTTLLRLVAGFEEVTSGKIFLNGQDIAHQPSRMRPINTVFQSYALFPHMTAGQNVAFGLRNLKRSRAEVERRTREMLALVRLEGFSDRYPLQLSGGQQQRIALARALAPAPKVLLLDEPLSALDFQLRKGMQSELKRVHAETGVTFILVTHDREEALAMSSAISVLDAGQLMQTGTPEDVYHRPVSAFVARFVSGANVFQTGVAGQVGTIAVRPEQIDIVAPGKGYFDAVVTSCDFVGDAHQITAATDTGLELGARVPSHAALSTGAVVGIHWRREAAMSVQ